MKHILIIITLVFATFAAQAQKTPAAAAAQKPAALGPNFSGKALESINTAGYTYVLLDTGKQKVWAAAVQFDVKKGDSIEISGAMPMANYHSKTLKRTFDIVYFASGVSVNGKSPRGDSDLPPGHPPISGAHAKPKVDVSGIKKAAGGKTIEEIFAEKSKLKNQQVAIRAKVVKYNEMILGKNWLHIQDGTGEPGNNDLVVTTDSEVKVGDTVLVTGKVSTDRDFGSGYKYSVIIENAKVQVE